MNIKFSLIALMVFTLLAGASKVIGQQVSGDWRSLGPTNSTMNLLGYSGGVTRTAKVKFHPTDPNIMYAISATGGLFISKDAGKHWVSGGTDMIDRSAFSTVCVDYTDDRIIYIGTGDPNYYGDYTGVWKTVDGGKNWTQSSTNIGNRLMIEILMSPFNHNVLIAATDDGLWKSTDAGATWTVKKPGGRFTDMTFKPTANGKTYTIYAAEMSRFYKSTDLGETWTQVVLPGAGIENGGRIGVSKADSNVVYLSYVGNFKATPKTCTPILKSVNSGASFTVIKPAGLPNLNGYTENEGGQGNYDYGFTVDPVNINTLYAGGHVVQKSTDGGVTWVRKVDNWTQKLHTDYHQFVFSPYNDSKLYNVNDGGISLSTDGGETWNDQNDGLAGLETGNAIQNPVRKDIVSCGAQDNGEYVYINNNWYLNGGGDYNHKLAFGYTKKPYRYDLEGHRKLLPMNNEEDLNFPSGITKIDGDYWDRVIVFSPLDTNLSFLAQKEVYRTTNLNSGPVWTSPLTSFNSGSSEIFIKDMAISPTSTSVLYVVTNDGMLHRTDNALAATPSFSNLSAPDATSNGSCIEVIKSNTSIVYMSCGGSIYRSTNKGEAGSWTNITDNTLDGTNIIEIIHDPYSTDESVYIATNLGVYYRNTSLNHWVNYSKGLPRITYVKQLGLFSDGTANSELRVSTNGRGVFTSSLYGKTPLMRDPENPSITSAGLSYNYYEGIWTRLPNFGSMTPVKTGTVTTFDITPRNKDDQFGFAYKGYINITTAGTYTFYLNSDEGSRLYIGDNLVVDNDGQHVATEVSGTINLKAGKHAISVYYFENTGSQSLTASYAGPSITKQAIPSTILFRLPDPVSCTGTGSVAREFWKNVSGNTVAFVPVLDAPYLNDRITDYLMIDYNQADNFGERLRGYLCPPYTGNYTFYITGNDSYELWLSTDNKPENKVKIAYGVEAGISAWEATATQKSAAIALTAGQRYYIEVLHKESTGDDYVGVGWLLPSGEFERPIPASRLSPFTGNEVSPNVTLTSPSYNAYYVPGTSLTLTASASDFNGTITKVEFFNNGTKLGEDLTAPYSFTTSSLATGNYVFTARATDNDNLTSDSYKVYVQVNTLRTPENPTTFLQGADYKYYEGSFDINTDYTTLTPVKTGASGNFDLSLRNREENNAFVYTGYINIPTDGFYTFYTFSDDVSKFYIGSTVLISNDNYNGINEKASSVTGLKAGKHIFRLEYANQGGPGSMTVKYEGPGVSKQLIPDAILFRPTGGANILPAVSITSPDNLSGGLTSSNVTITANATDPDGTVSKVEFFANGTKLGEDLTAPFSYLWTSPTAGTYNLTAKATDNNTGSTTSIIDTFYVMSGRVPENPSSVVSGLDYKYYEGNWSSLPDFTTLTPTATGNVRDLLLTSRLREDNFGFSFTGYLDVPTDGVYTFFLTSDDGSKFYIGNTLVVDNDGLHGMDEKDGLIGLKAGKHVIRVDFFESGGGQDITLFYSGPGLSKQSVPEAALYRPGTNASPSVSITAPANNASFTAPATINITASATDTDGTITKVEFYQGTTLLGTSGSSPYSYSWTSVAAGSYSLTAKAYDNGGATKTSTAIAVTVTSGNQLPTVSITAPANNASFTAPATISITASASDTDGTISKIEFYQGTTLLSTSTTSPYSYSWTSVAAGSYSLTAKAYDNAGGTKTSTAVAVTVTSGNQLPTVSITAPANNASFTAPATISITASASDTDGTISKVEFYQGTTLLGTSTTSPYSYSWTSVAAGSYSLTAKAYDNASGTKTSTAVAVTVTGTQACTFGTPLSTALPSIPYTQYNKVYVLGTGGPNLSNVTSFAINWDLQNLLLNNFSISTNNGVPGWYVDLKSYSTNTFGSTAPSVTITSSGFTGLDGSYYAGTNNGNFVLVSKTSSFTIYFSNSATAPSCTARLAAVTDVSEGTTLIPNPAQNFVEVQSDLELANANVRILNAVGSEVSVPFAVNGNSMLLDVSNVEAGIYSVVIREGERFAVKRMVVAK